MKKLILFIILFLINISNTFAYIDYRFSLKQDYYSSEIYMDNNLNIKNIINKKINKINNKIQYLTFEEKVNIIEKYKFKILSYLFKYHIKKDNLIYYRLAYLYDKLDYIKYNTPNKYKTFDYSENYNLKMSISNYYSSIK